MKIIKNESEATDEFLLPSEKKVQVQINKTTARIFAFSGNAVF
jgi:hypothetical protein